MITSCSQIYENRLNLFNKNIDTLPRCISLKLKSETRTFCNLFCENQI
jgi:hypothetical protein